MKRILALVWLPLVLHFPAGADPLFESDEILRLTLSAPFTRLRAERKKEKRYPAILKLNNAEAIPIEIQVRGNNRLKKSICDYPPLKLHLNKKKVKNTLFRKQSELKMVVLCKTRSRYSQYLRMEYLAYKLFAMVSENNFRVRWLDITYTNKGERQRQNAFFIEQKKRMGKRLGLTQVHENRIPPSKLAHDQAVLVDLFQFMIGNTDYSNLQAPATRDCCHNIKLMEFKKGSGSGFIPIPFDFDNSGLVNARYATPPDSVPIQSVTQRNYRGLCAGNPHLQHAISVYHGSKERMIALISEDEFLHKRIKKRAVKYITNFFVIIGSPKKLNRAVIRACRS